MLGENMYALVFFGGLATVHLVMGRFAGIIWKRLTYFPLPSEDIRAIRILWFAFLPLGLALMLTGWLINLTTDEPVVPILLTDMERQDWHE